MAEALSLRGELPHPFLRRDERLARRAARGDEAAFAAIFERYHQELYRYCYSILRDADDAQDALQSTMASALRALPGERREIALRPWLFRVAHNHAVSIARSRRPSAGEEEARAVPDPRSVAPEQRMRLRQLLDDLAALPESGRAALTMRELSGLSYDEIALALAVSPQAARQKVYEARVALHELEEGREMQCEVVRQKVSAGDRRSLRARKVRAHLRGCAACRDFRSGIDRRSADLAACCPPLPALAATAILHGLLGGGAGAGIAGAAGAGTGAAGTLAAGAAKGAGASLALKGTTTVAAAAALGVGAAGYSGIADVPFLGGPKANAPGAESTPGLPPSPAPAAPDHGTGGAATTRSAGAGGSERSARRSHAQSEGRGGKPGRGAGPPGPRAQAPAHSSAGGSPPAHAKPGGDSAAIPSGPPVAGAPGFAPPVQPPAQTPAGVPEAAGAPTGGGPAAPGAQAAPRAEADVAGTAPAGRKVAG